jgi:hypothetical protein
MLFVYSVRCTHSQLPLIVIPSPPASRYAIPQRIDVRSLRSYGSVYVAGKSSDDRFLMIILLLTVCYIIDPCPLPPRRETHHISQNVVPQRIGIPRTGLGQDHSRSSSPSVELLCVSTSARPLYLPIRLTSRSGQRSRRLAKVACAGECCLDFFCKPWYSQFVTLSDLYLLVVT